jgi:hypothetical protein
MLVEVVGGGGGGERIQHHSTSFNIIQRKGGLGFEMGDDEGDRLAGNCCVNGGWLV